MAKTLSKDGIDSNTTIETWHVSQSIDALTGIAAYNISISGSSTVTGSLIVTQNITGSNISASGVIYGASASFGSNQSNQWMDGWNGYDDAIYLTPIDFSTTNMYNRGDGGGPLVVDNGGSVQVGDVSADLYAMKIIPKGFEAYKAVVYGNDNSDSWRGFSGSISDGSTVTLCSATNIDTEEDFTPVVNGNGLSYVALRFFPSSTSDELHGAKIFIRRV